MSSGEGDEGRKFLHQFAEFPVAAGINVIGMEQVPGFFCECVEDGGAGTEKGAEAFAQGEGSGTAAVDDGVSGSEDLDGKVRPVPGTHEGVEDIEIEHGMGRPQAKGSIQVAGVSFVDQETRPFFEQGTMVGSDPGNAGVEGMGEGSPHRKIPGFSPEPGTLMGSGSDLLGQAEDFGREGIEQGARIAGEHHVGVEPHDLLMSEGEGSEQGVGFDIG